MNFVEHFNFCFNLFYSLLGIQFRLCNEFQGFFYRPPDFWFEICPLESHRICTEKSGSVSFHCGKGKDILIYTCQSRNHGIPTYSDKLMDANQSRN